MLRSLTLTLILTALTTGAFAQSFVVCNRGSGDITVFNRDGNVSQTVALPAATNASEPMYVVQVGGEVVVGDRGNDRVVRFDKDDYSVIGDVAVGAGVFHMWHAAGQLWVNNDVDNTTSVIDTDTWAVTQTIAMPADLVSMGYKNHDVFVTRDAAYVSLLGGSGATDWVVRYDNTTFQETDRQEVGKDPHLWHDRWSRKLFVASQDSDTVAVLDEDDLRVRQTFSAPGAHGIYVPRWSRTLLTTNLPNGGTDGLMAARIGWRGRLRPQDSLDTPVAVPHNIAASRFGSRIFVTHSGATANEVSIYRLRGWFWNRRLELVNTVQAGTNPFGIALVR
ncbi:MAG: hypothetical protein NXI31_18700 [bacterium]|nr:hypothetical protein [bacterium]